MIDNNDIYDLSITEKDFEDNQKAIEEFDEIYAINKLTEILYLNNKNINDPYFIKVSDDLKMNIKMAQIIDSKLHQELFNSIIKNNKNKYVLWKYAFKNAKIGDIIHGGKVIGIFTLTIWIEEYN